MIRATVLKILFLLSLLVMVYRKKCLHGLITAIPNKRNVLFKNIMLSLSHNHKLTFTHT